jgi:hypothetical protein
MTTLVKVRPDYCRAPCKDCGMDTEPWPPRRGTQEQYIVKDQVWQQAGMPLGTLGDNLSFQGGGGFLCVGCIEERLGRLLTINDFNPIVLDHVKGCQSTPRLLSRLGVVFMTVAGDPLPEHVVDQWVETTLRNATERRRPRVTAVKVAGDEIILVFKKEALRYRAGPKLKALRWAMRWDRVDQMELGEMDLLAP